MDMARLSLRSKTNKLLPCSRYTFHCGTNVDTTLLLLHALVGVRWNDLAVTQRGLTLGHSVHGEEQLRHASSVRVGRSGGAGRRDPCWGVARSLAAPRGAAQCSSSRSRPTRHGAAAAAHCTSDVRDAVRCRRATKSELALNPRNLRLVA